MKGDKATRHLIVKDMFARGAKPKTVSGPEPPIAEVAPKLGNFFGDNVVVGPKEMQYWNDFEKN